MKATALFLLFLRATHYLNVEGFVIRHPSRVVATSTTHPTTTTSTTTTITKNPICLSPKQQHAPKWKHQPSVVCLDATNRDGEVLKIDSIVRETALRLRRLSWLSWWAQLILTTVSAVTLVFARNVILLNGGSSNTYKYSLPNFVLAGTGIVFSFGSIFWTWASRRLARRLLKKSSTRLQAARMLRKTIHVGVTVNLIGMLFTIIGAEQIVGALAIKVLTTGTRTLTLMENSSMLQPLDILVVQANTNTLFSHFCSLVSLLYLTRYFFKLDPPSVEGDERRR